MNNIIPFAKAKRDINKKRSKKTPEEQALIKRKAWTNREIFEDILIDVKNKWEKASKHNRLNEYFLSCISNVSSLNASDLINDLNTLSQIESSLGMCTVFFAPKTTMSNPHGWLAAFHRGKEVYATLPDFSSESFARAFNILLFLHFECVLSELSR